MARQPNRFAKPQESQAESLTRTPYEMPGHYWNLVWLLVLVAVFAGLQWLAVRRIERDTPSRD